eukprot:jgi/Sobl393_1/1538/SZX64938.1
MSNDAEAVALAPAVVRGMLINSTSASPTSVTTAGTAVTYSFKVYNSGNVKLRSLQLLAPALAGNSNDSSISCSYADSSSWTAASDLAAGASLSCSGSFSFNQDAIEAGDLSPLVTATADNLAAAVIEPLPAIAVPNTPSLRQLLLTLTRTDSSALVDKPDAVVHLSVEASNGGNVHLRNVTVDVPNLGALTCSNGAGSVTLPADLLVGSSLVCSGSFAFDQDALEAGSRSFSAAGAASSLGGAGAFSNMLEVAASPQLQLDVDALNCSRPARMPGNVTCPVELRNSGNMRLANVAVAGDANDCDVPLLEPNADARCFMTRALTQDDFDSGVVELTATGATAIPRGLIPALVEIPTDTAAVPLNQTAAMDLSAAVNQSYVAAAGDSVRVTFTL